MHWLVCMILLFVTGCATGPSGHPEQDQQAYEQDLTACRAEATLAVMQAGVPTERQGTAMAYDVERCMTERSWKR
jgi:hypothetical protein